MDNKQPFLKRNKMSGIYWLMKFIISLVLNGCHFPLNFYRQLGLQRSLNSKKFAGFYAPPHKTTYIIMSSYTNVCATTCMPPTFTFTQFRSKP